MNSFPWLTQSLFSLRLDQMEAALLLVYVSLFAALGVVATGGWLQTNSRALAEE